MYNRTDSQIRIVSYIVSDLYKTEQFFEMVSGESADWLSSVIDIATGRIHKRIDCPDEMFFGSYPTFYGDKMYIMGLPNYLYCYSVDKMER